MNRFKRFQRNAGWEGAIFFAVWTFLYLAAAVVFFARGQWHDPLVWTPVLFFVGAGRVFTPHSERADRIRPAIFLVVLIVTTVGAIVAGVYGHQWLMSSFAGAGIWVCIGEWFWRTSDSRYIRPAA